MNSSYQVTPEAAPARSWHLLNLSGSTARALDAATAHLIKYLQANPDVNLRNLSYTLSLEQENLPFRRFVICEDRDDALRALETCNAQKMLAVSLESEIFSAVFLFPGGGAQHVNMGRDIYQTQPVFRQQVDFCSSLIEAKFGFDLRRFLYPDEQQLETSSNHLVLPGTALPALFVTEYALAKLWMAWGMRPQALMGHSLGEYVAACLAGVISLEAALELVVLRGRLLERLPAGAMLSVMLPEEEVCPLLGDRLSLAAINAPSLCVVSGPVEDIEELARSLRARKVAYRRLPISGAGHSRMTEAILDEFTNYASRLVQKQPTIPYISNVTGTWITDREINDTNYWAKHLRQTVRFAQGMQEILKVPNQLILEVGPGQSLSPLVRQTSGRPRSQGIVGLMRHSQDQVSDVACLFKALGQAWVAGVQVDWRAFHETQAYQGYRLDFTYDPLLVAEDSEPAQVAQFESAESLTDSRVAPRNEVEQGIAEIWGELLELEEVGVYDRFFESGGHSLLAMRLFSRLSDLFHVQLTLQDLLREPTISGLAETIMRADPTAEDRQLPPIEPTPRDAPLPLSFSQQQLWVLHELESSVPFYNVGRAFSLSGKLNLPALERSLDEILRRHETLRTNFVAFAGKAVQVIAPFEPRGLEVIDLSTWPESERQAVALHTAREQAQVPFDLRRDALLRVTLLRLSDQEHWLLVAIHHIIFDAWSLNLFVSEMSALYQAFCEGRPSPLPELAVQYADYAVWQRHWLRGEALDELLAYWQQKLAGASEVLQLPTDHPRPAVQTFQGARQTFVLSQDLADSLKALALREGVTLYMLLLAAYQALLYRYSRQPDIIVGTPTAGRLRAELEPLIGFFINMLVLRTNFSDDPDFRELLHQVRATSAEAFAHQHLPFEKLVEEIRPPRSLSHTPIFQVTFALQNVPMRASEFPGLSLRPIDIDTDTAKFDLMLFLWESEQGLAGAIEYNTALFDHPTVARLVAHLRIMLQGIIENPQRRISELPLLTEAEQHQSCVEWNHTRTTYPSRATIAELFAASVESRPGSIALEFDDAQVTYRELNQRANQLARYLRRLGLGSEGVVGIYLDRSIEMIVAMLGILKAGGAYLLLDRQAPKDRVAFMLEDAEAQIVITEGAKRELLPDGAAHVICLDTDSDEIAGESTDNLASHASFDHLACIIYTSGSTGVPKGIAIPQQAVIRLVCNTNYIDLSPSDRIAHLSNPSFDATTFEVWSSLLHGARLVIIPKDIALSPAELAAKIITSGLTTAFVTTSLLNQIIRLAPRTFDSLDTLIFGGEAADANWIRKLLEQGKPKQVLNGYGPTESTTFATLALIDSVAPDATTVPIGRPMSNTSIYLLDANLQPVPVGIPGEIYIGGAGLARGYVNSPATTAEKFVPAPFGQVAGARLYKTGDLGRLTAAGEIEFIGRIDHQVKLRGFRIELSEIEAALTAHPDISATVALIREDKPGDKRLTAYVISKGGQQIAHGELTAYLSRKIPEYMIPASFVFLDSMPLTPNGKLDHQALPAPDRTQFKPNEIAALPRNPIEETVAEIFAELLGLEQVSIFSDFFEMGGHSLLATQMLSRVREIFNVPISLRLVFEAPTVVGLATEINRLRGGQSDAPPDSIRRTDEQDLTELLANLDQLSGEEIDSLLKQMQEGGK
jgi:amino acid adenylation domain-containing protein